MFVQKNKTIGEAKCTPQILFSCSHMGLSVSLKPFSLQTHQVSGNTLAGLAKPSVLRGKSKLDHKRKRRIDIF